MVRASLAEPIALYLGGPRRSGYERYMHVINRENHEEAAEALRDILLMFEEMAYGDGGGFAHGDTVYLRFDPLKIVDAEIDETAYVINLDLLRSGYAVAIMSMFYDLWPEEQTIDNHPLTRRHQVAVEQGRLSSFPDIEGVIREVILRKEMPLEDLWFDSATAPIYRKYVQGFFAQLASFDRGRAEAERR